MMTRAREQIISLEDTPYYHCMARCVRRAYLFGEDSLTGRSFDHRKQWVVTKLAELADVFCIDVCAYAVMSNHYHVVLRINAEQCQALTRDEVIHRWLCLFSGNVLVNRYLTADSLSLSELAKVDEFVADWRLRLMDISWFMRVLNEFIARKANEEEGCKGRFWEGRFKSQALLDEAAVLACMMYVDLNPVRAGVCDLPEESDFTSIQQRMRELAKRKAGRPKKTHKESSNQMPELFTFNRGVELQSGEDAIAFSLSDYLKLIDWTGRAIRNDKKGAIPEKALPILERLNISQRQWIKFVPSVEKKFHLAIGSKDNLRYYAQNHQRKWMHGQALARCFYQ